MVKGREIATGVIDDTVTFCRAELLEQAKIRNQVWVGIYTKPEARRALRTPHKSGELHIAEGIASRGSDGSAGSLEQFVSSERKGGRLDHDGVCLKANGLLFHGFVFRAKLLRAIERVGGAGHPGARRSSPKRTLAK